MKTADHLVYATPDLAAGVAQVEERLGVKATPGGQHLGLGTRNALISLGGTTYLEVIGPDREQPDPLAARPFGIDALSEPRLVTWAMRATDLNRIVANATHAGIELGEVRAMSRTRPDGVVLSWLLTDFRAERENGLIPFLIDWGDSPHPADSLLQPCELIELRAELPDPERLTALLHVIGVTMPLSYGHDARLIARIQSPRGEVELR